MQGEEGERLLADVKQVHVQNAERTRWEPRASYNPVSLPAQHGSLCSCERRHKANRGREATRHWVIGSCSGQLLRVIRQAHL